MNRTKQELNKHLPAVMTNIIWKYCRPCITVADLKIQNITDFIKVEPMCDRMIFMNYDKKYSLYDLDTDKLTNVDSSTVVKINNNLLICQSGGRSYLLKFDPSTHTSTSTMIDRLVDQRIYSDDKSDIFVNVKSNTYQVYSIDGKLNNSIYRWRATCRIESLTDEVADLPRTRIVRYIQSVRNPYYCTNSIQIIDLVTGEKLHHTLKDVTHSNQVNIFMCGENVLVQTQTSVFTLGSLLYTTNDLLIDYILVTNGVLVDTTHNRVAVINRLDDIKNDYVEVHKFTNNKSELERKLRFDKKNCVEQVAMYPKYMLIVTVEHFIIWEYDRAKYTCSLKHDYANRGIISTQISKIKNGFIYSHNGIAIHANFYGILP